MKPARPDSWAESARVRQLIWLMVALVAGPLVLFTWWVVLQAPSRLAELTPVRDVSVWHEAVGPMRFDQDSVTRLVRQAPDWSSMTPEPVTLPDFRPLGVSVDLPPEASRARAWYRISVPPEVLAANEGQGRLGLLGYRAQGGPWALWVDGQLLEAHLADWRIQWNVPLRAALPLGASEVWLAVAYTEALGYSVGTVLVGPMDVVESAWRERNAWHLDLPRFMAGVGLLLMLVSFHLAWLRPQEPMFALLGFNALVWSISCLQFAFDVTGQDGLSLWFGAAVDASITWTIVLACVFAFDLERIQVPRLRMSLVGYAAASTVLTLPLWGWQKNALIAQQYFNVAAFLLGLLVIGHHLTKNARREGVVMFLALAMQLALGIHTLENLTNQTNPDSFYSFPLGTLALYLAFMYAMVRRLGKALHAAERHEATLRRQLDEQEQRLRAQHAQLQALEVQRQLSTQHEAIMQDLHDTMGSNLTTALLRARTGALAPDEMTLLLQDLASELRHLGRSGSRDTRGLNDMLADLRERMAHRLGHGGIALEWAVDPRLPRGHGPEVVQQVRALLSEAVANAIRHAGARHLRIGARCTEEGVVFEVVDDGQGFDPSQVDPGRGLPGMRKRAGDIGAQLRVQAQPAQGCRIEISLPHAPGVPGQTL